MVECAVGSLYSGWSPDLENRIRQDNAGRGSKYVRSRLPAQLRYSEGYDTRAEAMRRECALKKLSRSEKIALIEKRRVGL